jgi:hypothetical protein
MSKLHGLRSYRRWCSHRHVVSAAKIAAAMTFADICGGISVAAIFVITSR